MEETRQVYEKECPRKGVVIGSTGSDNTLTSCLLKKLQTSAKAVGSADAYDPS